MNSYEIVKARYSKGNVHCTSIFSGQRWLRSIVIWYIHCKVYYTNPILGHFDARHNYSQCAVLHVINYILNNLSHVASHGELWNLLGINKDCAAMEQK